MSSKSGSCMFESEEALKKSRVYKVGSNEWEVELKKLRVDELLDCE